jgi:hypothetical protein
MVISPGGKAAQQECRQGRGSDHHPGLVVYEAISMSRPRPDIVHFLPGSMQARPQESIDLTDQLLQISEHSVLTGIAHFVAPIATAVLIAKVWFHSYTHYYRTDYAFFAATALFAVFTAT